MSSSFSKTSCDIITKFELIKEHNDYYKAFLKIFNLQPIPNSTETASVISLQNFVFGFKDLVDIKDEITTAGSMAFQNNLAVSDAEIVKRIRTAGAVIAGKMNLVEFALGATGTNQYTGTPLNPHNNDYVPGGSSSGSAVAVALGLVDVAIGTDTGGSIRTPASACGVVGFKPSYGVVSTKGIIPLAWSLDHVGPLGQTVSDCAVAMQAMAGYNVKQDPKIGLPPNCLNFISDLKSEQKCDIVVGIPSQNFFNQIDSEIEEVYTEGLQTIKLLGHKIVETELSWAWSAREILLTIMLAEAAITYQNIVESRSNLITDRTVLERLQKGLKIPTREYLNKQSERKRYKEKMSKLFEQFDILAIPTMPCLPATVDEAINSNNKSDVCLRMPTINSMFNLTGQPAISVNCGYINGLPVGIQFVGKYLSDNMVLQFSDKFEQNHKQLRK